MLRVVAGLMAASLLFAAGCAGTPGPGPTRAGDHLLSVPTISAADAPLYRETGIASWYGGDLQGRTTASGEVFDMYGLSAAHRTLPLGTVITVTNLDNSRNITLKVNDRGPFVRTRVLEVSYGAARKLGFASKGTATVRIEARVPAGDADVFTVQAAVFSEEENAKMLRERLQRKYEVVTIVPFESNAGKFYRVRVGAYASQEKAERIASKLTLDGLEPVVVRKD